MGRAIIGNGDFVVLMDENVQSDQAGVWGGMQGWVEERQRSAMGKGQFWEVLMPVCYNGVLQYVCSTEIYFDLCERS